MIYWANGYGICTSQAPFFREGFRDLKLLVVTTLTLKFVKDSYYAVHFQAIFKSNNKGFLTRRLRYLFGRSVDLRVARDHGMYSQIHWLPKMHEEAKTKD